MSRALTDWLDRFCQLADDVGDAEEGTSHLVVPREYRGAIREVLGQLEKLRRPRNGGDGSRGEKSPSIPRLVRTLEEAGVAGLTEAAVGWPGFPPEVHFAILDKLTTFSAHGEHLAALERFREMALLLEDLQEAPDGELPASHRDRFWDLEPRHRLVLLRLMVEKAGEPVLPLLAGLAGKDEEVDLLIVELAAESASTEAVGTIQAVRAATRGKPVQKAVSRALYRLRSRGIDVGEELEQPEKLNSPLDWREPVELQAFSSSPDWRGQRLILLGGLPRTRGFAVAQALLDEELGVREFTVWKMSRADFRDMVTRANTKGPLLLCPVEQEHAFFLLEEAYQNARARGRNAPDEFLYWRAEDFWEAPDLASYAHPVHRAVAPAPGGVSAYPADEWKILLESGPQAAWTVGPEESERVYLRMQESREGPIIVPGAVRQEREERAFQEVISTVFTPELCRRYGRRLEETAYLLSLDGQQKQAAMSLVAAAGFVDLADRIWEHPFAAALIHRDLEREHEHRQARQKEDVSLISSPWDRQLRKS